MARMPQLEVELRVKETSILTESPRLYRGPIARGLRIGEAKAIDREGGAYGAGLIRSAAVITRGEALGHDMWIDSTMLVQVDKAINLSSRGIKSRFTHPGLSADGLGRGLGRFRDAELDGDVVRADLHLFESAHDTPDGDLAGYVMNLAAEDPASFGTSIAFEPDIGAEDKFVAAHEDKDGRFRSPDEDNKQNFPHARLASLSAVDMVDEPAANPDGLFHRGDSIAFDAEEAIAYVLGLQDDPPGAWVLGIAPERIRAFWRRFCDRRRLRVFIDDITGTELEDTLGWKANARARELELERD